MQLQKLTIAIFLLYLNLCQAGSLIETIIPTSESEGRNWKYAMQEPGANWTQVEFSDSDWQSGQGGFGSAGMPGGVVRTVWEEKDIWLRQEVNLDTMPDKQGDLVLRIHHDEDARVWLNGNLIASVSGWTRCYSTVDLDESVYDLLRPGRNILAVHCRQTTGGEYIDVGLEAIDRWSAEKATEWYQNNPWPCGFNYVPANSISYTEMWMDYNFDKDIIEAELALAEKTGFNCLRVVLPYVVWEHDPAAFRQRFNDFLEICDRHSMKVMPAFFDDCVFGRIIDPKYGQQPEVVTGWYANGWTPSPGHSIVRDQSRWPALKEYISDITRAFRTDKRILCWDVYNEPTNGGLGNTTLPLLEQVFQWVRQEQPTQPLTAGIFDRNDLLNSIILRYSDIITLHCYDPANELLVLIKDLQKQNRPIICTEWLNRNRKSTVAECLPVFAKENVGCLHWGLVNGKTQTDLSWGHRPGDPTPPLWQHDLYRSDFKPYDQKEIDTLTNTIRQMRLK